MGDRKEEVITTPFPEKKSSTKDVDEGTDELSDMPLTEKKYSTKDVDKGTDEFSDMKQAVVTIRRKCLDQFEGQYSGSKILFKVDSGFIKTTFSNIHLEFYEELL